MKRYAPIKKVRSTIKIGSPMKKCEAKLRSSKHNKELTGHN
ncbi:MAG: hypothetical protein ABF652_06455 [Clostridium beijerinckii]